MYRFEKGKDGKIKKVKKKRGFTDKLQLGVLIYVFAVNIIAIFFAFMYNAESIWWYLIPSTGVLGSAVIGSAIQKNKAENLLKIRDNPDWDDEQLQMQIDYEIQNQIVDAHRDYTDIQ